MSDNINWSLLCSNCHQRGHCFNAVFKRHQCFKEVKAAPHCKRATRLVLAVLEPSVDSVPSEVAFDSNQAFLPGALVLAGSEPSIVPGLSDVMLDITQVWGLVVPGNLQLGAAVPEVRALSYFGDSLPALLQVEYTLGEPGSQECVASSTSSENRKPRNK